MDGRTLKACQRKGFGPETVYYQTAEEHGSISKAAKALNMPVRTLERKLWIQGGRCGSCGARDIAHDVGRDKCRECYDRHYCINKEWRVSEEGQQYNYRYVRTEKFRKAHQAVNKRYYYSDRGQTTRQEWQQSDKGKEAHKQANSRYLKTPKGRAVRQAIELKRRRYEEEFASELSGWDVRAVRKAFGDRCVVCGMTQKEHKEKYQKSLCLDHFYPLIDGYSLTLDNVVLLCQSDNSSKNSKNPKDFFSQEQIEKIKRVWEILCQRRKN